MNLGVLSQVPNVRRSVRAFLTGQVLDVVVSRLDVEFQPRRAGCLVVALGAGKLLDVVVYRVDVPLQ